MTWFWSDNTKVGKDNKDDFYAGIRPDLREFAHEQTGSPSKSSTSQVKEEIQQQNIDEIRIMSKNRKAVINSAAMFNCAVAEAELNQCFKSGSWWDKAKLCEVQKGAFWSCLEGNKKLLQELGYGEVNNTADEDERLMDKADELVHETS